jgi:hypothetical protein
MSLALALLLAASTATTPFASQVSTERLWTPADARETRDTLLQQDLDAPFTRNCNWIRTVEVGQGRAVKRVDAVVLRVSGFVTPAGSAHWGRRSSTLEPHRKKVLLHQAGAGLKKALVGVSVGSKLELVVLPHFAPGLAEAFELPRGRSQLHLMIDVLDARD